MKMKGIGVSSYSSYKKTSSSEGKSLAAGSNKGFSIKSSNNSNGVSQMGDKAGKADGAFLSLSGRQIGRLLITIFKACGEKINEQFYKSIQLIFPGVGKNAINSFLIKNKLASKSDEADEVILKNMSNRQVTIDVKRTKMEMGEYDLSAASSAASKYISTLEEKDMGHKIHKKSVTEKVAKGKAKKQKERTGRAAPDSFHASLKKSVSAITTAMVSKDCQMTLDSYWMGVKRAKKKTKNKKRTPRWGVAGRSFCKTLKP